MDSYLGPLSPPLPPSSLWLTRGMGNLTALETWKAGLMGWGGDDLEEGTVSDNMFLRGWEAERIHPYAAWSGADGQDLLHRVKSQGSGLVGETMTHRLQGEMEAEMHFILLYFHLQGTFIRTGSLSSPCTGGFHELVALTRSLPLGMQLPHFAKGNDRFLWNCNFWFCKRSDLKMLIIFINWIEFVLQKWLLGQRFGWFFSRFSCVYSGFRRI